MNRIARIVLGTLLAASVATIAACNTVKGAGRDIQSGAEATQDAINGD
jgi:predicted small secreted protein